MHRRKVYRYFIKVKRNFLLDCLEEQIHLIAKHAPDWATVKTTSKGEVLCIQPKAKFNQAVLQLKAYVASANTANGPFQ